MKKKDKDKVKEYNHVLGIDLGTSGRCGVALWDRDTNSILAYETIRRLDSKNNLEHRYKVLDVIDKISSQYAINIILFESIRLFSYGHIQMNTILSLNKLQTTIINRFSDLCDIYQVDVRSWKSKVLGNANVDKNESITFVRNKYSNICVLDEINKPIKKEIVLELNNDLSDAICIAECLKFDRTILQDKNKMNYK